MSGLRLTSVAAACALGALATLNAQSGGWSANPEVSARAASQQPGFNYDEAKVGVTALPDPLQGTSGRVSTAAEWPSRRAEILELFRAHVYGRTPTLRAEQTDVIVLQTLNDAMAGRATLQRIGVVSRHEGRQHRFEIVLFLPNNPAGRVPVFLLLNNRPVSNTDPTRATQSGFWPAEDLIARGYGIAAIQNNDMAPDDKDTFRNGVIQLFEGSPARRATDAWGALGAWAWGASRTMDYFAGHPRIDAARVAVVGHSRGGKAALWAGAQDQRFALVISNESGEGGAALARRNFGETVTRINTSFPHWFADTFKAYNGRPEALPIDQHMLLALIAPRALYVASADEDLWSDPRGEFLALAHTSPVYRLWNDPPIGVDEMPPLERPLRTKLRGYHVRKGAHNLTPYDWGRFADFADILWSDRPR
jgi:hypothetical protein